MSDSVPGARHGSPVTEIAGPEPRVAIAVVSWNTRSLLAACLRSMKPAADAGTAEVWVVDNGSTDGSVELVRRHFAWVNLVLPAENLGFGRAVNAVARRTRSEWIAPANADVELEDGALEALLDAGEADPCAGIVAPRLVLPDGSTQPSLQPFPTIFNAVLLTLQVHRLSRRLADRLFIQPYRDPGRLRSDGWASGAFMLVRRGAWDRVDGFDECQWMYAEDLDLGWRTAKAGRPTLYVPSARVRHALSAAAEQAFGDDHARAERWMSANYSWIARRRGVATAWATASVYVVGILASLLPLWLLAQLRPTRWHPRLLVARRNLELHRLGLRRPGTLLLRT